MFPASWQSSIENVEKFNYLGFAFTNDGRQNEKQDVQSGKANAVRNGRLAPFCRLKTRAIEKGKTLGV